MNPPRCELGTAAGFDLQRRSRRRGHEALMRARDQLLASAGTGNLHREGQAQRMGTPPHVEVDSGKPCAGVGDDIVSRSVAGLVSLNTS